MRVFDQKTTHFCPRNFLFLRYSGFHKNECFCNKPIRKTRIEKKSESTKPTHSVSCYRTTDFRRYSILTNVLKKGKEKPQRYSIVSIKNILRNFRNATFYVDCFLYWVDLMLFPIQYFILSRDKQQLTVKRILLRPFILTLP